MWTHVQPPRRVVLEVIVASLSVALLWFAWRADAQWFARHVVLFSFVVSPLSRWFCQFGRAFAIGLALILLLFVRPKMGRWIASCSLREAISATAGVVVAVLLSLMVSELGLRYLQQRIEERRRATQGEGVVAWNPSCDLDPRYGYVFHASRETLQHVGGRTIPLSVNAQHNRARTIHSEPDPAKPTIFFVGESITVGSGLYYDETFPALVGKRLGLQEVNLAALGYGSDQAYLRLVDALPNFSRPVAVVTLFLPGMLSRNFLAWRAHLDFDDRGELAVQPPHKQLELWRLLTEKFPFWTDATIDRSIALSRAIFVDTVAQAKARGTVPLFIVPVRGPHVPREQRADWWILRELFERDGLPYLLVELDDHSEIPGDGHPNPHGAEQLADAVTAALAARLAADRNKQPAFAR